MAKKAVPKVQKVLEDMDINMFANTICGMEETGNKTPLGKPAFTVLAAAPSDRGSVFHCRTKVVVLNIIMLCKDHN